jgi:hypothetical protein
VLNSAIAHSTSFATLLLAASALGVALYRHTSGPTGTNRNSRKATPNYQDSRRYPQTSVYSLAGMQGRVTKEHASTRVLAPQSIDLSKEIGPLAGTFVRE